MAELAIMLEKNLSATYGVSRDTAGRPAGPSCRNLARSSSRQIPTNDK